MPTGVPKTTVLIVEDGTLDRMYGTDLLEDAGFEVLAAQDADAALDLLSQRDDVALLFIDVEMPGSMNGLELARVVHERWPNIRLLLTSGHHQLREAALPDAGRFVRKPWDQGILIQKIRDMLSA